MYRGFSYIPCLCKDMYIYNYGLLALNLTVNIRVYNQNQIIYIHKYMCMLDTLTLILKFALQSKAPNGVSYRVLFSDI